MQLRRLSYRSLRVQPPEGPGDAEFLTGLVLPSMERNKRYGVTGCLYWGERTYVQFLEGETHVLDAFMARIVADPRHRGLRMLMDVQARVRLFETWSLKLVRGKHCVEVDGLAEAIVDRTPRDKGVQADGRTPCHGRMEQLVSTLVGVEGDLL